jgi:hypothetical protein
LNICWEIVHILAFHAFDVMQAVWQYRVGQKVEKYNQEETAKLEKAYNAKDKQAITWKDQLTGITHQVSLAKREDRLSNGTTASVLRYVPGEPHLPFHLSERHSALAQFMCGWSYFMVLMQQPVTDKHTTELRQILNNCIHQ